MRLSIGRDRLGLELGEPATLGCLQVTHLFVAIPGMRFPLDVSGGVSRFRNRRGALGELSIELGARALERWAAPRLRGLLGVVAPEVHVAVRPAGATITIADRLDPLARDRSPAMVAFDVAVEAHGGDLLYYVHDARGADLGAPATATALRAMQLLVGSFAVAEGARFVARDALARLTRALLPDAGIRAPSVERVGWHAFGIFEDGWFASAQTASSTPEASEQAALARQMAELTARADGLRVQGAYDAARAADLAALDWAPRHAEICRRIAEIDAFVGGRAEAALATLADATPRGSFPLGTLRGELLAEVGRHVDAVAELVRAGESENAALLSARAYARAAELSTDVLDALLWLDHAVARAPRLPAYRWARLARRLFAGRLDDARADAEHLEALAETAHEKYAVWLRTGEVWRSAGLVAESEVHFERALRFLPDDPSALSGVGAALVERGRTARGVSLLARAIEMLEARREPATEARLSLARALGDKLGDRPAAIAKAREVPDADAQGALARVLEARWRKDIGDVAGAALAYARVAALAPTESAVATDDYVAWLVEAAEFERTERDDAASAQKHLYTALRLRPRDANIERAYRDVCAQLAPRPLETARQAEVPTTDPPSPAEPPPPAPAAEPVDPEARAEELTRRLQADPTNDTVVDELSDLLAQLGRGHELLALLAARLEDAPPERRASLLPKQREVLERLERDARAEGRAMEADLFRDMRLALD